MARKTLKRTGDDQEADSRRRHWELTIGICTIITTIIAVLAYAIPRGNSSNGDDALQESVGSPLQPKSCTGDLTVAPPENARVAIDLFVATPGSKCEWAPVLSPVKPGHRISLLLRYENASNRSQKDVAVRLKLPDGLVAVPTSTHLYNSDNAGGVLYDSDELWGDGIVIGDYAAGAVAYVTQTVRALGASPLACGINKRRAIGFAQPHGMNYFYNTADVNVMSRC